MLTQLKQIDTILAKVLLKIEKEFLDEGGIKEAMSRARRESRKF